MLARLLLGLATSVAMGKAPAEVRAVAAVFLDPGCPLSQAATVTLNAPGASGRKVLGIVPRLETHSPEMTAFRRQYALKFPLIGDPDLQLTRALGAKVTPEVFLVDSAGNVLYQGAVDNQARALGKKRRRPTRVYLDSAWDQWTGGRPVDPSHVPAVGCFIQ
jgi:hypothetical protein